MKFRGVTVRMHRARTPPAARGGSESRPCIAAVLLLPVFLAGCQKAKEEPAQKTLGQQVGDVTADTALLRDASAAVNEVLRNSTDCDLAKPTIAAAIAKLDEAAPHVRTVTGHATLESLRKQVRNVEQACP